MLIFDEVVTGFALRQAEPRNSTRSPDLSTFAKILAGGLPGGAVAGRAEIFNYLATPTATEVGQRAKIHHPGTFNANPLSAAAGVAMLSSLADSTPIKRATNRHCQAAARHERHPGAKKSPGRSMASTAIGNYSTALMPHRVTAPTRLWTTSPGSVSMANFHSRAVPCGRRSSAGRRL